MSEETTATAAVRNLGGDRLPLPVGSGGMGTVFLAEREVVLGVVRAVAVKVLHG